MGRRSEFVLSCITFPFMLLGGNIAFQILTIELDMFSSIYFHLGYMQFKELYHEDEYIFCLKL